MNRTHHLRRSAPFFLPLLVVFFWLLPGNAAANHVLPLRGPARSAPLAAKISSTAALRHGASHSNPVLHVPVAHYVLEGLLALGCGIAVFYLLRLRLRLKVMALRNLLAGELHEEVVGSLGSIRLIASMGLRTTDLREREKSLRWIQETCLETGRSLRDISWSVAPGNDSTLLLLDQMQRLGAHLCRAGAVDFAFVKGHLSGEPWLNRADQKSVYRIYREALLGSLKFAAPTRIEVFVSCNTTTLHLEVSDNGQEARATQENERFAKLYRWAADMDAKLDVQTQPNEGTELYLDYFVPRREKEPLPVS